MLLPCNTKCLLCVARRQHSSCLITMTVLLNSERCNEAGYGQPSGVQLWAPTHCLPPISHQASLDPSKKPFRRQVLTFDSAESHLFPFLLACVFLFLFTAHHDTMAMISTEADKGNGSRHIECWNSGGIKHFEVVRSVKQSPYRAVLRSV